MMADNTQPFDDLTVRLVEQHIIRETDPRFAILDANAFASKNLYNLANYTVRQEFIHTGKYLNNGAVYHRVKQSEAYCALPRKVSNQVLLQVHRAWVSFFEAIKLWRKQPELFLSRPRIPGYKHKTKGRNLVVYETGAIGQRKLRQGIVAPSQLGLEFATDKSNVKQVRVVSRKGHYVVEIVYEQPVKSNPALDYRLIAGTDLGVSNLATTASNKVGFVPFIVNGRPLKALNQFYNKLKAGMQSLLAEGRHSSRRIIELSNKRNRRVKDYLHKASRYIVDRLVAEGIGTLVIGYNQGWKQAVEIGRANNQTFVNIPHAQFVQMLSYKARLAGIHVILQEESYTSKCSFLDLEPVAKQVKYAGRRITRGLFRSAGGRLINADLNGAYNIIRKAIPNAFDADEIAGVAVHPVRVNLTIGPAKRKPALS
jgi:putative transposase